MFGRKKTKLSITATGTIKEPEHNPEPQPIRKIIDGKLYDTSKAKLVAEINVTDEELHPTRAFHVDIIGGYDVDLMKTGNGNYFITAGRVITPITEEKAKIKVEESGNIEAYTKLFGQPEEA